MGERNESRTPRTATYPLAACPKARGPAYSRAMHCGYLQRGLVACVWVLLAASFASAQTGPDLLVKPWLPGQYFQSYSDGLLQAAGHSDESNDTIRLSQFHTFGRYRVLPDSEATPRLGYDVSYLDIDTIDPALPKHLYDGTIGFAQPLAKVQKWFVAVTGAVGYAGSSPFSDSNAYYGSGNLIVGRVFDKDQAILIALNYDGNRTFLPDTPIPGFAYAARLNPHATYVLGLPYSSITYEPITGVQLEAGYTLVNTFEANLAYKFIKPFALFVNYSERLSPYHLDNTSPTRRLFFQTHDAEAGISWNPTKLIRFSISGGWAFGQEFSNGFDSRNLHPLRHLSDAPFARVQINIGY